jgi:hypothetical protein
MHPAVEYLDIVKKVFVLFKDCELSFNDELKSISAMQKAMVGKEKGEGLGLTREELDKRSVHILKKDPITGKYDTIVKTTQKEWKERLSKGGENINFIGNMCLVLYYQYWEDNYRGKIADKLGYEDKDDLKNDLFGDINKYRNSIIHHNSIATEEIEKCKILKWYKEGDEIVIDYLQMEELFLLIEKEIKALI